MSISVAEIVVGGTDNCGRKITYVYSRYADCFAIYRADNNVFIHYADHPAMAQSQRGLFAPLRPLRGEINVLIRKLMIALAPPDPEDRSEREFYLIQIADALYTGLIDNGTDQAIAELERVRSEIEERLTSIGRLQFARQTVVATGLVFLVIAVFVALLARIELDSGIGAGSGTMALRDTQTFAFFFGQMFWAAVLFGALGAWFSIALGLRNNDVLPSKNLLDNLLDPSLRIVIAVIAAVVLFCIVRLDLVTVSIGGNEVSWQVADSTGGDDTAAEAKAAMDAATAVADAASAAADSVAEAALGEAEAGRLAAETAAAGKAEAAQKARAEAVAARKLADEATGDAKAEAEAAATIAENLAALAEEEAAAAGQLVTEATGVVDELEQAADPANAEIAGKKNPQNADVPWRNLYVAILLAFLAGFSERLVGNFLLGTGPSTAAAGQVPSSARPRRMPPVAPAAPTMPEPATDAEPPPVDDPVQGEDTAEPLPESDAVPDEQLPPATGGVAAEGTDPAQVTERG